jgi:predicted DNA-binding protein
MVFAPDRVMLRKRTRLGRPPLGVRGERVSDYPQVMIRLPAETKALLDALSGVTGTPIWRLIDQAVDVYLAQLPEAERRLIDNVRDRRAAERRRRA